MNQKTLLYCALALLTLFSLAFGQEVKTSQNADDLLKIYSDVAETGETDTRQRSEREVVRDGKKEFEPGETFDGFFIYPANIANRQTLNHQAQDNDEQGTHYEATFNVGSQEFCGIKFIPGGVDPGGRTHPGLNVKRKMKLTGESNVFLTFRARTLAGKTAMVTFKSGGTAGRKYKDSLVFPVSPAVSPSRLTEDWQDFRIPLKGKDLSYVICPFEIVVLRDENPGNEPIAVHVDDVQYEVLPNRQQ